MYSIVCCVYTEKVRGRVPPKSGDKRCQGVGVLGMSVCSVCSVCSVSF